MREGKEEGIRGVKEKEGRAERKGRGWKRSWNGDADWLTPALLITEFYQ